MMMTPADRAAAIMKDARFKQARKCLKEKNYEDSIEIFSSLVQSCNETYGEMSVEAAAAWYEYGNVLLLKEEENPTNDLLGNVQSDPSQPAPEDEDVGDEEEANEGEEGEDGEDNGEEPEEIEGDLQIAWEALDLARATLTKQDDATTSILLSDVYMRLGDLNRFNSNTADAISEYQNALFIRNNICKPYETALSDTHFSLAVAYIYNSSEKDLVNDPIAEKKKALAHYKKARESIVEWIKVHKDSTVMLEPNQDRAGTNDTPSSSSSSSSSSTAATTTEATTAASGDALKNMLEDKTELADMLQETIDAVVGEIAEMEKGESSSSSSSTGMGVTTIGFGQPSTTAASTTSNAAVTMKTTNGFGSASTTTAATTTIGFNSTNTSSTTAPAVTEVKTLQVKRKRPIEDTTVSAVEGNKK